MSIFKAKTRVSIHLMIVILQGGGLKFREISPALLAQLVELQALRGRVTTEWPLPV